MVRTAPLSEEEMSSIEGQIQSQIEASKQFELSRGGVIDPGFEGRIRAAVIKRAELQKTTDIRYGRDVPSAAQKAAVQARDERRAQGYAQTSREDLARKGLLAGTAGPRGISAGPEKISGGSAPVPVGVVKGKPLQTSPGSFSGQVVPVTKTLETRQIYNQVPPGQLQQTAPIPYIMTPKKTALDIVPATNANASPYVLSPTEYTKQQLQQQPRQETIGATRYLAGEFKNVPVVGAGFSFAAGAIESVEGYGKKIFGKLPGPSQQAIGGVASYATTPVREQLGISKEQVKSFITPTPRGKTPIDFLAKKVGEWTNAPQSAIKESERRLESWGKTSERFVLELAEVTPVEFAVGPAFRLVGAGSKAVGLRGLVKLGVEGEKAAKIVTRSEKLGLLGIGAATGGLTAGVAATQAQKGESDIAISIVAGGVRGAAAGVIGERIAVGALAASPLIEKNPYIPTTEYVRGSEAVSLPKKGAIELYSTTGNVQAPKITEKGGYKSFEVTAAPGVGKVGGSRAKLQEKFFFFAPEKAASSYGAGYVARGQATGTVLIKATEKISPFKLSSQQEIISIASGQQGGSLGLRRQLGEQIRSEPGKIFYGPRGPAYGFGESEVVAAPGTRFYDITGRFQRRTYDPFSDTFARVQRVSLKKQKPVSAFESLKQTGRDIYNEIRYPQRYAPNQDLLSLARRRAPISSSQALRGLAGGQVGRGGVERSVLERRQVSKGSQRDIFGKLLERRPAPVPKRKAPVFISSERILGTSRGTTRSSRPRDDFVIGGRDIGFDRGRPPPPPPPPSFRPPPERPPRTPPEVPWIRVPSPPGVPRIPPPREPPWTPWTPPREPIRFNTAQEDRGRRGRGYRQKKKFQPSVFGQFLTQEKLTKAFRSQRGGGQLTGFEIRIRGSTKRKKRR